MMKWPTCDYHILPKTAHIVVVLTNSIPKNDVAVQANQLLQKDGIACKKRNVLIFLGHRNAMRGHV